MFHFKQFYTVAFKKTGIVFRRNKLKITFLTCFNPNKKKLSAFVVSGSVFTFQNKDPDQAAKK
jgi:hypothetical protein